MIWRFEYERATRDLRQIKAAKRWKRLKILGLRLRILRRARVFSKSAALTISTFYVLLNPIKISELLFPREDEEDDGSWFTEEEEDDGMNYEAAMATELEKKEHTFFYKY